MLYQKNLKTMMKNYLKLCSIFLILILSTSSCDHEIFESKEVVNFYVERCIYEDLGDERFRVQVFGFSAHPGLRKESVELDTYFNASYNNNKLTVEKIYDLWKSKDIPEEKILKLEINFYSGKIIKSEVVNYPVRLKEEKNKDNIEFAVTIFLFISISVLLLFAAVFTIEVNWDSIKNKYNHWKKKEKKEKEVNDDPLFNKLVDSGYNKDIVKTIISQERKNLGLGILLIGVLLFLSGCSGNELLSENYTINLYVERASFKPDNGRHTISGFDDIILEGFYYNKEKILVSAFLSEYEQHSKENYDLLNKIYNKFHSVNFKDGEVLQVRANFYRRQLYEMKVVNKDSVLLKTKEKALPQKTEITTPIKTKKPEKLSQERDDKTFFAASIPFMGLLIIIVISFLGYKILSCYKKFEEFRKSRIQNKLKKKLIKSGYSQEIVSKIIRDEIYLLVENE